INTYDGADEVNVRTLSATTDISGGTGNDTFRVNYAQDGQSQTFADGVNYLAVHGNAGDDSYLIGLSGTGSAVISVKDNGAGPDVDRMNIYGTNAADFFLFRPKA